MANAFNTAGLSQLTRTPNFLSGNAVQVCPQQVVCPCPKLTVSAYNARLFQESFKAVS